MIWSIYPTGTEWIVGEERETEKKKTTFFALNRISGRVAWSKALLDDWWVGVEAVTHELIFLHGFATPDMPFHKGITAVDVLTGNRRWEQPDLCFERSGDNAVVGSRGSYGNKHYVSLDTVTGHILGEWMDPDSPTVTGPGSQSLSRDILYPETLPDMRPETPSFVRQFLKQCGHSGPFSWASTGPFAVIGYQVAHSPEEAGQITQNIAVIRISDNAELFSDITSGGPGMFIPDSFLIQEGMLYYVRRKHELVAVNLMELQDDPEGGTNGAG